MAPHASQIRSYQLFGESAELPDVLHCETIAARSALHDWELAPHRHGRLHQLLYIERGGGAAHLEGREYRLQRRSLVNVAAGDVHAFSFDPGTQGHVATFPLELLDELLEGVGETRRLLGRSAVTTADAGLGRAIGELAREFEGRAAARALVLRGLAATALGLAARAVARSEPAPAELQDSNLLRRFEALLEAHWQDHWSVADYAGALAITPTHLSRIARSATGQGASRLIEERLLREARRQLVYTHLRVKTIAYALGFADPAHFTKLFTRAAGISPRAFRSRLAGPREPAARSRDNRLP
jgi:AraC family transcriptional activator of pobA